jgi:glucosyl-3-phosphoglycerate synthase
MFSTFRAGQFRPADAVAAKRGRRISVCLPARDEAATVGVIVERIRAELVERHPLVDEILVVDDGSADRTAAVAADAGARVVHAPSVLAGAAPGPGKGEAMWKAVHVSTGELVAFCDADVVDFEPDFVTGLVGPLLTRDDVAFVKGFYERPLGEGGQGGGRVTELAARPAIALLHPHLSGIRQPLAGECAARREVFESVPMIGGYGVDLGLLIDVAERYGVAAMAQVDLGRRVHRNRSLHELSAQATAVTQVALQRSGRGLAPGLPWQASLQRAPGETVTVTMTELPPLRTLQAGLRSA